MCKTALGLFLHYKIYKIFTFFLSEFYDKGMKK